MVDLHTTNVLLGIMAAAVAVVPAVAKAEEVKAHLTFADGNGTNSPIRRATVEIWRKTGGFWHSDFTVITNENGSFDTVLPARPSSSNSAWMSSVLLPRPT